MYNCSSFTPFPSLSFFLKFVFTNFSPFFRKRENEVEFSYSFFEGGGGLFGFCFCFSFFVLTNDHLIECMTNNEAYSSMMLLRAFSLRYWLVNEEEQLILINFPLIQRNNCTFKWNSNLIFDQKQPEKQSNKIIPSTIINNDNNNNNNNPVRNLNPP